MKARAANEKKRFATAREAGIILEKKVVGEEERRKKAKEERKRRGERGDGFMPSVGKWRNGGLVLSKGDIREVQGSGEKSGGGKSGKKGKGKGKGKGKRR